MRAALKRPAYRLGALYWRLRSRGRIRGRSFRIRRPRELVLAGRLTIGDGTCIDTGASIVVRAGCRIGSDAYLGRDLVLVAFADVELGDRVLLGERVSIHTEDHGPPTAATTTRPPRSRSATTPGSARASSSPQASPSARGRPSAPTPS
jgi:maltose O-acetyltransferase